MNCPKGYELSYNLSEITVNGAIMIMSENLSLENGLNKPRLSYKAFEKRVRTMIEAKSLTNLELKKLLLDSEAKFVPLNSIRSLSLPSVSIVVPVYNDENRVITCLKTLVRQTYRNILEIIVVDDGSTDDSLKVIKEFENKHQLVQVIESRHHGRSIAKNIGIEIAKGKIILFAESDAMYAPWYLEKAVNLFITKNADAVMLQGSWILNTSIISKCILVLDQIKWSQISTGKKKIESAWVYKTEIVRQVGGFDKEIEYGEDKDLLRRIISVDARIEYGTGYNWFHPTQNSLKQYFQRRFDEQRNKVVHLRNRKGSSLLLSPVMIILMVACLFTFLIYLLELFPYFLSYALFALFLLFYFIRLSNLLRERKNVSYRKYLFILPLISILTIFPRILGSILSNWKH